MFDLDFLLYSTMQQRWMTCKEGAERFLSTPVSGSQRDSAADVFSRGWETWRLESPLIWKEEEAAVSNAAEHM